MKNHLRSLFILLLTSASLFAHSVVLRINAQTPPPDTSSWVKVAPADDGFTASMPLSPVEMRQKEEYDKVSVEVRRYTATTPEKTIYTIWSLSSPHKFISALAADEISSYLDWCAEIVWDAVLEPKLILLQTGLGRFNMTYQRDLQPLTGVFAREYWLELGRNLGIVHIYYSERRAFIVMALEVPVDNLENARKFVSSFKIETPTTIALKTNRPFIPDAQPSSQQVYSPRDTTQKARLLSRPEPQYTNAARKFHVSGTVVLRAVFSSNGKVTNIRLVSGLPHGLSKASIDAAREIKFTPALRDGQPVSQFIQIEYNYNLY